MAPSLCEASFSGRVDANCYTRGPGPLSQQQASWTAKSRRHARCKVPARLVWALAAVQAESASPSAADVDGPDDSVLGLKRKPKFSAERANQIIGMGSWRLKGQLAPVLELLTAQIEGAWRTYVPFLQLHNMPKEWKYLDSLDPKKEYGSWSYLDLEDPESGSESWPRLQIENRAYQGGPFRKLHLELCVRQDGLEVLHCVMYPHPHYDLPILSLDMVAGKDAFSLCIADPCPITLDRSLPDVFVQATRQLQQKYGLQSNRAKPDWGAEIFSDQCVIMRPQTGDDVANFVKYAVALTHTYLQIARNTAEIGNNRESRMEEIGAATARYCEQQMRNSKTRRVLESAFDAELAEKYMRTVMFDGA